MTKLSLIGDSLGVGLQSPLAALALADGSVLTGHAKISTTIDDWSTASLPARPDLWLVSLGTNDALLRDPTSERQALGTLLSRLGPRVIWIEPAASAKTPKLTEVMGMVQEAGVRILPPPANGYERGSDQIHATPSGYKSWAQYIWLSLKGSQ